MLTVLGGIFAVVVVIGAVGSATTTKQVDVAASAGPTASVPAAPPASTAAAASTAAPAETSAPAATASVPPAAPTATPAAPTASAPRPRVYSGHGSKVVRVSPTEEPGIVTFTHRGSANFIVYTVTSSGDEQNLLVNTIGRYAGTRLYNDDEGSETAAFKIQADGAWTMKLLPAPAARVWSGSTVAGRGDDVMILESESTGLETLVATYSGRSNFIVYGYGETADLLVNEIGRYRGEVLLPSGTVLVTVQAEGSWTLTRS